jgi:hypothetical protein
VFVPCQGPFPVEQVPAFSLFSRDHGCRVASPGFSPRADPPRSELVSESRRLDREDCTVRNEQGEAPVATGLRKRPSQLNGRRAYLNAGKTWEGQSLFQKPRQGRDRKARGVSPEALERLTLAWRTRSMRMVGPPHPPFGHLLPAGEKGMDRRPLPHGAHWGRFFWEAWRNFDSRHEFQRSGSRPRVMM